MVFNSLIFICFFLVVFAVVVGGSELFWRSRGFSPSARDSWQLWGFARERIRLEGSRAIVLLGSSRTQLGIRPRAWTEAVGGSTPIQLAIDAATPFPIMEDLVKDGSFRGVVLCEVHPQPFFDVNREWEKKPRAFLREYGDRKFYSGLNAYIGALVDNTFAFRTPALHHERLYKAWKRRELPARFYIRTWPDRWRQADYEKKAKWEAERTARSTRVAGNPVPERRPAPRINWRFARGDEVRQIVERMEALVKPLQARGATVDHTADAEHRAISPDRGGATSQKEVLGRAGRRDQCTHAAFRGLPHAGRFPVCRRRSPGLP